MVAKITVPQSIRRALNYNEQKVRQGQAVCLLASGFLKEAQGLNFQEKLARFEQLIQLNKRSATNTVHISLNFAEGEKLAPETLQEIACLYMEKIGFANQPFLVYEHRDAGHPHLHIVTTNIQRDGRRLSLHNLGKGTSEKARKELELQFNLVRAQGKQKASPEQSRLAQKAVYGKGPTQRAITNVLEAVLPRYKYASLAELNAILQQYNVQADRGTENSMTYRHGGLLYHMLDERGKKVGVPLKASTLYNKPTLSYLEEKFRGNAAQKLPLKKRLQATLDWIMIKPPDSLAALEKALQAENIALVVRQNEEGFVYGLTYIDHRTGCVFNGSDLGKAYSARAVMDSCGILQTPQLEKSRDLRPDIVLPVVPATNRESPCNQQAAASFFESHPKAEQPMENIPFELRKRKKKRRKM